MLLSTVRGSRHRTKHATLFFAAAIAGALLSGAGILLLASLLDPIAGRVLQFAGIVFTAGVVLLEVSRGAETLPQRHWQIPMDWVIGGTRSPRTFGFVLGLGWATYLPSYAIVTASLLLVSSQPAIIEIVIVCVAFAAGRSTDMLAMAIPRWSRRRDHDVVTETGIRVPLKLVAFVVPASVALALW